MTSVATAPPWIEQARTRAETWPGLSILGGEAWGGPQGGLRDSVLSNLTTAYAAIAMGRAENYALWQGARKRVRAAVEGRLLEWGMEAAPMYWEALMRRVAPRIPSPDPTAHVAFVEALLTDYSETFAMHCEYRLATAGNIHLSVSGPTGLGKSSGAITIADWLDTIEPAKIEEHVNFDLGDLPNRFQGKKPRQTVIQDEFVAMSGEGANTIKMLFTNLEDTLRGSQVNLFVLSPRRQEHGTMQADLEAVAWNPARHYTLFMVWVYDEPHGVIAVPWCNTDLWTEYSKFKARNVGRSMSGHFRDHEATARIAMQCFEDERVCRYLTEICLKPKKASFDEALEFWPPPGSLSIAQHKRVVEFMHAAAGAFDRFDGKFEEWFGVAPNDGLKRVAEAMSKKG